MRKRRQGASNRMNRKLRSRMANPNRKMNLMSASVTFSLKTKVLTRIIQDSQDDDSEKDKEEADGQEVEEKDKKDDKVRLLSSIKCLVC